MADIKIGDILNEKDKKVSYRIIYISEKVVVVCKMHTTKLVLLPLSIEEVVDQITDEKLLYEAKTNCVLDINKLSEKMKQQYERNKEIMKRINDSYAPTYLTLATKDHKPQIQKIAADYEVSKLTVMRLYIRYLQSGMDESSLVDPRAFGKNTYKEYEYKEKRPGRKVEDGYSSKVIVTDEIKKQFDEALEQYKKNRFQTIESAYAWLCQKHYTKTLVTDGGFNIEPLPEFKVPTIRQFRYYASKKLTIEEIDVLKTSKREVRNNKRILLSDSLYDILGPGDMAELDAVEVDLSIVSEADRTQTIGRPIMYIMVDIYTKMILAMSVALDNNSVIGLTNLFLNLADDKVKLCARYGHKIDNDAWISGVIPRHIRVDRGADFRSDKFVNITEELGIDRQLVSAASGSLKGTVEQEFRTLHSAFKPHLGENGVITRRYDSKHHQEASITIQEFTKIAIDFVLHHNQMAIKDYPYTADMIRNEVHANPQELWKYGCMKYGSPRPIINKEQYLFSLMSPVKAKLNRKGLRALGLYYMNWDDKDLLHKMYAQQDKVITIEMRYDPRDISQLYYLDQNGNLLLAPLNEKKTGNSGYSGMTYYELKEYKKLEKKLKKDGERKNRIVKNSMYTAQEAITQEAVSRKKEAASPKNMRENRNIDKQKIELEHSIKKHLVSEEQKSNSEVVEKREEVKSNQGTEKIAQSFEEALDMFYEDN